MCGVTLRGLPYSFATRDWMKARYFTDAAKPPAPPVVVYGAGTMTCSVWMPPTWAPPTPEPGE